MQRAGVVTAVRAAAMGLVATGLIEVLARVAPRFDPLYVYLGAVALVVLLDGVLAGALTAIAATEIYALLYAPSTRTLLDNTLWALTLSTATILAAAFVRGLVRARRRPPDLFAPMPPMLETTIVEEPVPQQSNAEILAALDELRAEVRAAVATPREPEDRREEIDNLERMLAEAHSGEAEQRSRADSFAAELTLLRMELHQSREENTTLAERIAELEEGGRLVRQKEADETSALLARIAELESAAREAERTREDLEKKFDAKLETIVSHLASDHENDLGQALADKEEARAEARLLSARLATLQKRYEEDHETATRLLAETRTAAQQQIDSLRTKAKAAPLPPPPRDASARARILVAHPDADLRRNAQTSLEAVGYEVMTAADGLEALRLASTTYPDVVIADAVMPKMNGRELCQLLKSQDKTAHIRVVLLLRNVDEAPKGELMPDDVLRKPVPFETLRTTLASLLAGQRA